jgi:hypothetical protein
MSIMMSNIVRGIRQTRGTEPVQQANLTAPESFMVDIITC